MSVPGRGTKRGRDNEIEKVRYIISHVSIDLTKCEMEAVYLTAQKWVL